MCRPDSGKLKFESSAINEAAVRKDVLSDSKVAMMISDIQQDVTAAQGKVEYPMTTFLGTRLCCAKQV